MALSSAVPRFPCCFLHASWLVYFVSYHPIPAAGCLGRADEGEPGSGLTTAFNSRRRRTIHPQLFWLDISHPYLLYAHVQLTENPERDHVLDIENSDPSKHSQVLQKKKERERPMSRTNWPCEPCVHSPHLSAVTLPLPFPFPARASS